VRSSPSAIDRKEQLVAAATKVLMERGVAACTARTIADASPLSKSSVHYYFDDVDELVDVAMTRLMDEFIDRIEEAASAAADPVAALWAAAKTYLELGTSHPGRIPLLWFEYQVAAVRRGRIDVLKAIIEHGATMWERFVTATGVADATARGRALFAALIGSIVEQSYEPRPVSDVLDEIADALSIPRTSEATVP
jgi:AcrR family transcriptional regulator